MMEIELIKIKLYCIRLRGHAVAQLDEALRYKPEGRGFDSPMVSLEFFIDIILPAALWAWA
jgi:hypothetical protein